VRDLGIEQVLCAPRSPGEKAYVERLIGTIRRECLNHVIIFSETALYRQVKSFVTYYHESRTHLSLDKDSPESRLSRMVKKFMRRDCSIGVGRRDVLDSRCQVADGAQAEQGRERAERCSCLGDCVLRDNAPG
jgi:hypothetical protein